MTTMIDIIAFGMPGPTELIVIGVIALLIFGKRLPEVGKSLGKSIVEFKKGLKGIEDDIEESVDQADMLPPPEQQQLSGTDESANATDETVSQSNATQSNATHS